ncbi:TPA: transporter substrate-binding domain-containing protein [Vibrio vulnificus]|nr:transporter substrate-binding domain-containing protein [Vibrio vulnificus]HAS6121552.1 transporter substrate-binding domain-containing protein [Vibrio vulnificus]HAS6134475.1 transporter substrate-binding domain-containing protein [Vibrio vulnificus]HAT8510288.1 transporter substrate-binding domain-containing protein [Vibrio vulnificus]HAT8538470.1 transporter substrate-binding domain-containing protein [Vibrio vulnificus]
MIKKFGWLLSCVFVWVSFNCWAKSKEITVATEADDVVTRVLFDAIAEQFALDVTYVNMPSFDAILDSVARGETDFAANITFTHEREKRFSYSHPTNIEYTYLYSNTTNSLRDATRIGVPQDTIYGELIAVNHPDIQLVSYQGHEEAYALISHGQVDGIVDAINQLKPMLLKGTNAHLLNDEISIKPVSIVSQKGQHLEELTQFAQFIHSEQMQKRLREEITQYQFAIRKQALQQAIAQAPLDLDEPLTIKLEPIYPYVIYHPDGHVSGITAEVLQQSCDILALNCQLVSRSDERWGEMLQGFIQQEFDLLAPLAMTKAREQFTYYTSPHYAPQSVIVKRLGYKPNVYSHVSQLIAERVGVVEDDYFDALLTQMLPLKELSRFSDHDAMVSALLANRVDYITMDTATLNYLLRNELKLAIEQDDAIGVFDTSKISIGLANTEKGRVLAPYFSRAIEMLDLNSIIERYDVRPDWRSSLEMEQKFAAKTQTLFAAMLLLAFALSYYLHRLSNTDNLTGLGNRRQLQRKYGNGIAGDLAILYIDVNNFKPINDTYGHHCGDMVLKAIAQEIKSHWRGKGFRVGGDEFILIGKASQQEVEEAFDRFSRIRLEQHIAGKPLIISSSIGLSARRERAMSLQKALHLVDVDMYQSKNEQREMGYS